MSKKKNKFDLTHLVHDGVLKEGQTLFFVSDPKKSCVITKHPSGEYKVVVGKEMTTLHLYAVTCLGIEPPDHASKWFKNEKDQIIFDLWHQNDIADAA